MKNEDLCDLIFRKNFTFGRRTSKFAKENPQNCPPLKRKEKEKKNPKHLKCSLTRAKDESHKRVKCSLVALVNVENPFLAITPWSTLTRLVSVRSASIGQIGIFNNLLLLKSFNSV